MQCEIQICPRFKAAWINQLQKTSIGSLWHPNGVRAKVALYVNGDDCYMVNGRFAAACFGFREPTKVILTYEVSDNIFKMTTIKNESVEMWSSDGSDDESIIMWKQLVQVRRRIMPATVTCLNFEMTVYLVGNFSSPGLMQA
jgi:hypothetical protein